DITYANCATQNNKVLNLYSSFRTPVAIPDFVAATVVYDLQEEGISQLDSFWRFDSSATGGCNAAGLVLHIDADALNRCSSETNPWGTGGGEAMTATWTFTPGFISPNRGRLVASLARPAGSPFPLSPDQDYY